MGVRATNRNERAERKEVESSQHGLLCALLRSSDYRLLHNVLSLDLSILDVNASSGTSLVAPLAASTSSLLPASKSISSNRWNLVLFQYLYTK
ncbi:hypothetical protein KCV07_g359, partial [Aureobasidium melanogenum]